MARTAAVTTAPAGEEWEKLLDLAKVALPDVNKDPDGKVAELLRVYREYLRGIAGDRREVPLLLAARHALLSSRAAGRPSLGVYACKSFAGVSLPRMMELCHPSWPAYPCVVARYHDNGLFANVLQVCDLLLLGDPGAPVLVDWRRQGEEGHFQYGPAGFDLWQHLFEEGPRCRSLASAHPDGELPGGAVEMRSRINCVFFNMLRGYFWTLPEPELAHVRREYAAAAAEGLRPAPWVLRQVDEVCRLWRQGARVVGVHKRLGTSEVAAVQLSQRAAASEEFARRAASLLEGCPTSQPRAIFLATDDLLAVQAFEQAFPRGGPIELYYRGGVKRTNGGVRPDGVDNEVHRSPCEAADAADALIDALCLARCHDLVCIDSNLAIYVALANPDIALHPLSAVLPDGWEEAAAAPAGDVYDTYRVAYSPMVFVRSGPSTAAELLGARKVGELVSATGRYYAGWVEIVGGGWMLTDSQYQVPNRGEGCLLEPVGPPLPRGALGAPAGAGGTGTARCE